ncbi:MAG: cysteine peptidase family C39 domain-containing protein, partial [Candidatus Omnitrophota bacterium]
MALLVVAVFLPEQASWAMGYDPSVLWAPRYYLGAGQAGYMANFVAENVRRSLTTLEDKTLGQIEIAPNLVVEAQLTITSAADTSSQGRIHKLMDNSLKGIINGLEFVTSYGKTKEDLASNSAPANGLIAFLKQGLKFTGSPSDRHGKTNLYLTKPVVKQIYEWLRDPSAQVDNYCGVYALQNLLEDHKIDITLEDLALRVILVDLLSGNIKELKGQLKTSLYALNEVAESLGVKVYPIKTGLDYPTPFIAHLSFDHFVYVTAIDGKNVYYREKDQEITISREAFTGKFSGYGLSVERSLAGARLQKDTVRGIRGGYTYETITDRERAKLGVKPGYFASWGQGNGFWQGFVDTGKTLWWDLNDPKSFNIGGSRVRYNALDVADLALTLIPVPLALATKPAQVAGNTLTKAAMMRQLAKGFVFRAAINEAFLQGSTYLATGHANYDWKANLLMIGMAGVSTGASAWANSSKLQAYRLANLSKFATSQAALSGNVYALTGIASGAFLSRQAPEFDDILKSYTEGVAFGAAFGSAFGGVATFGSKMVSMRRLAKVAKWMKAHPKSATAIRFGGSAVAGAALFPAANTVLELESGKKFSDSLKKNYSDPWNYARGAVLGAGAAYGFTSGKGPLRGVLSNNKSSLYQKLKTSGKSSSDIDKVVNKQIWALRGQKIALAGTVGVAAGPGINYLKGDYGSRTDLAHLNWTKAGLDAAGAFVLGGATGIYIGMQGKGIQTALKQYTAAGVAKAQETKAFFNLISLGKAKTGAALLEKHALAGAIDWTVVSPAFTIGGKLWDSAVYNRGSNSLVELFTTRKGRNELIQGAIMGPRSGIWMKPVIGVFQAGARNPNLINQGGAVEKIMNVGRGVKNMVKNRSLDLTEFRMQSWSRVIGNAAGSSVSKLSKAGRGILSAAKWADSSVLFMPGFVTGIDSAVRFADRNVMLRFTGTTVSDSIKSYAKWLPFFMVPSFNPGSEDMFLARFYSAGKGKGFGANRKAFSEFERMRSEVQKAGGLEKAIAKNNQLRQVIRDRFIGIASSSMAERQGGDVRDYVNIAKTLFDSVRGESRESIVKDLVSRQKQLTKHQDKKYAEDIYTGLERLKSAYDKAVEGNVDSLNVNLKQFRAHENWLKEGRTGARPDAHKRVTGVELAAADKDLMATADKIRSSAEIVSVVRSGVQKSMLALTDRGIKDALAAKEGHIKDIEMELPSGAKAKASVLVDSDMQRTVLMSHIEKARESGQLKQGSLLKYVLSLKKLNRELVKDALTSIKGERDILKKHSDIIQEHLSSKTVPAKKGSAENQIGKAELAYHRASVKVQEAYFNGASRGELNRLTEKAHSAARKANIKAVSQAKNLAKEYKDRHSKELSEEKSTKKILKEFLKSVPNNSLISEKDMVAALDQAFTYKMNQADLSVLESIEKAIDAPTQRKIQRLSGMRDITQKQIEAAQGKKRTALESKLKRINFNLDRIAKDAGLGEVITLRTGSFSSFKISRYDFMRLFPEFKGAFSSKVAAKINSAINIGKIEVKIKADGSIGLEGDSNNSYVKAFNKMDYGTIEAALKGDAKSISKALAGFIANSPGSTLVSTEKAVALALKVGLEKAKADLESSNKEFQTATASEQVRMVRALLSGNSVAQRAGGGKTVAFIIEMLAQSLSTAKIKSNGIEFSLNHVLVVKPGEEKGTVLAGKAKGKGDVKLSELLNLFGVELVNGTNLYAKGELGRSELRRSLLDPNKIVVFDQVSFGHLRNFLADQALLDAVYCQDVVRFDEFHLPFSDKVTYITGQDKMLVRHDIVQKARNVKRAVEELIASKELTESTKLREKLTLAQIRRSAKGIIYVDGKGKWG